MCACKTAIRHSPFAFGPPSMSSPYKNLTGEPFRISALLHQEAAALTLCSPMKDTVKAPNGSKSNPTLDSKQGRGSSHCMVRQWPSDKLPAAWGARNRTVLLDEVIQPAIWTKLSDRHESLRTRATHSRLVTPLRSGDNGNEEVYRSIVAKIFERVTAAAFVFFLNQWLQPQNEHHPDLSNALATLMYFEVKEEHTCKNFNGDTFRNDVVVQIGYDTPFPILKAVPALVMVTISMANLKSTGNAEFEYSSAFTSPTSGKVIASIDQCMDHLLSFATAQPMQEASVKELTTFLSKEVGMEWPQIATSHFAQVKFWFGLY